MPDGSWQDAVAAARTCAIPSSGGFECWTLDAEQEPALVFHEDGEFDTIWGHGDQVCALDEDGQPTCRESDQPISVPDTALLWMDMGGPYCGVLSSNDEIYCWTYNWADGSNPPVWPMPDPLPGIAVSGIAITGLSYDPLEVVSGCAIRQDDSTLSCWGSPAANAPTGRFVAVDMGVGVTCALDESGGPHCWASPEVFPATCLAEAVDVNQTLTDIAVDTERICGLDDAGAPMCWQCTEDD